MIFVFNFEVKLFSGSLKCLGNYCTSLLYIMLFTKSLNIHLT